MERLCALLKEQGFLIVRLGLAGNGMVTLRLRRPGGSEFEIDFYPDELEANPDNALSQLKAIIDRR